MVSSSLAVVLALISLIASSLLAVIIGYLSCILLRLSWGWAISVVDVLLAPIVAIACAYAMFKIDSANGVLQSRLGLVLAASAVAIVLRHLCRLMFRSSG